MDMPDTLTPIILIPALRLLMPIRDWVMALDYGHGEEDAALGLDSAVGSDAGLDADSAAAEEEALDSGVIRDGGKKIFFKIDVRR
jgi:hypothetical protein